VFDPRECFQATQHLKLSLPQESYGARAPRSRRCSSPVRPAPASLRVASVLSFVVEVAKLASLRLGIWTCLIALSGCSLFSTTVRQGYEENSEWKSATIYTTADVRIVSRRTNPVTGRDVVCTEPSPDVAKALSTVNQFSLSGGEPGANGSVGLSAGTAEAVAELAGRSTALLALRDGLFRACETYGNGAIGANAYALVLSRYGHLLTTLFLGQDITGASAKGAVAVSPVLQFATLPNSEPTEGASSGASGQGVKKSGSGAIAGSDTGTSGGNANKKSGNTSASGSTANTAGSSDPAASSGSDTQGIGGGTGANTSKPSASVANKETTNTPNEEKTGSASSTAGQVTASSISSNAALALARMNEDYFDLDLDLPHLLIIACVNEFDETRLQVDKDNRALKNSWLRTICDKFQDATTIIALQKAYAEIQPLLHHPAAPIDPVAAVKVQTNPPDRPAPPANPESAPAQPTLPSGSEEIRNAQIQLYINGFDPGPADSILGPRTVGALKSYQRRNNLPLTGKLDAATKASFKNAPTPAVPSN
jgi:hypothetical protein